MTASAPSLSDLRRTLRLGEPAPKAPGELADSATHIYPQDRWRSLRARAKAIADQKARARERSWPPPAAPTSVRQPKRMPSVEDVYAKPARLPSRPSSAAIRRAREEASRLAEAKAKPSVPRSWLVITAVILAADLLLVLGSLAARYAGMSPF